MYIQSCVIQLLVCHWPEIRVSFNWHVCHWPYIRVSFNLLTCRCHLHYSSVSFSLLTCVIDLTHIRRASIGRHILLLFYYECCNVQLWCSFLLLWRLSEHPFSVHVAVSVSLTAGLILLAMSLFRLGFIVTYMSDSFISGYLAASNILVSFLSFSCFLMSIIVFCIHLKLSYCLNTVVFTSAFLLIRVLDGFLYCTPPDTILGNFMVALM